MEKIIEYIKNIIAYCFNMLNMFNSEKGLSTKKFVPVRKNNWFGYTVGINKFNAAVYGGDQSLSGCVNDSKNMVAAFDINSWVQLLDSKASIGNYIDNFIKLAAKIKDGDVLLLHHSRHGASLEADYLDKDETNDEAAVMYDGLILDDCIFRMFKYLPKCTVIYLNDSCFSETQYKNASAPPNPALKIKSKALNPNYIPSKDNVLDLKQLDKLIPNISGTLKCNILSISGCRDTQTSADAYVDKTYQGAFTWAFLKMLKESPNIKVGDIQYAIRKILKTAGFEQQPVVLIEGDKNIASKTFLEL